MTEAVRAGHWTVVGRYELMGVNGSLLPTPIDPGPAQERDEGLSASIVAGELRLGAEAGSGTGRRPQRQHRGRRAPPRR